MSWRSTNPMPIGDLKRELGELMSRTSYEALPEGYGLGHNMMAGAFAGIAVSRPTILRNRRHCKGTS